jgi:glycosyltransferase involved in cell wall biosynthesis
MTVLHVINQVADHGGAEVSLIQSLPFLERLGIHNVVQPLYDNDETSRRAKLESLGITILPPLRRGLAQTLRDLLASVRSIRPDLIHSSLWDADVVSRLAGRALHVPVAVSFVNMQYSSAAYAVARSPYRLRICQLIDGFLARHLTDGYHALTNTGADSAAQALRLRRKAITVIPRGRDVPALGGRSPARAAETRQRLGLAAGVPIILNVGRQEPQKNQPDCVRAFDSVAGSGTSAHLLIAGDAGTASGALRHAVATSPYRHRIHVLGYRADVMDLIAAADVVLVTSLWEGFGGAVAEAMCVGTPVVATATPAVSEVLDGHGFLAEVGDRKRLAAILRAVLDDPGPAAVVAARAKDMAVQRYDIEAVAAQMAGFYRRIAAGTDDRVADDTQSPDRATLAGELG